ncbi:hypothetical protein CFC21_014198 [Triticum aestivum]|uniref:Uncharacterized protein n=3 Tax=Triticinae TaxID=1648030 RepID=A0A3B6A2M6_WHEAT|nr:hypothetical protein CFC21_014198 [Triticum aestivum]
MSPKHVMTPVPKPTFPNHGGGGEAFQAAGGEAFQAGGGAGFFRPAAVRVFRPTMAGRRRRPPWLLCLGAGNERKMGGGANPRSTNGRWAAITSSQDVVVPKFDFGVPRNQFDAEKVAQEPVRFWAAQAQNAEEDNVKDEQGETGL